MQRYFSIGDDYGTGIAPYTLTVYYEPNGAEMDDKKNTVVTPKNSVLLFALINNLEEINYGFRPTPGDGELEKDAYISRITHRKLFADTKRQAAVTKGIVHEKSVIENDHSGLL